MSYPDYAERTFFSRVTEDEVPITEFSKNFNKNFTSTYQICSFYMVNCLNKIFHWIYKKKNSKNVPVLSL